MKHDFSIKYNDVFLRPLEERDLELIRSWRNRDEIRKWFIDSKVISKTEQRKWFYRYINKDNEFMFMIEDIVTGKVVGTVALYNVNLENRKAEFGRLIIGDKKFRGKGIAEKATRAMCKFGFEKMNLKEIYLEVFTNNKVAIKVYTNVGFKCISSKKDMNNRKLFYMILYRGD